MRSSGFRRYGNYPREVTAPVITWWGTMSPACRAILIPHILLRIIQIHSQWVTLASTLNTGCYKLFQGFLVIYNHYVTVHGNCSSSTSVIYKENHTNLDIYPPLKLFHRSAWEIFFLLVKSTWYYGKTPETSLEPAGILVIQMRLVVAPGLTMACLKPLRFVSGCHN